MTVDPGFAATTQNFDDYTTHADVITKAAPRWIASRQTFRWFANLPWQLECAGFAMDNHFRAVRLSDLGLTIVPAGGSKAIEWIIPIADINLGDLGFDRISTMPGRPARQAPSRTWKSLSADSELSCRGGTHAHGSMKRSSSPTAALRWRDCSATTLS